MRPDIANADNMIPVFRYDELLEGAVISKNNLMWTSNKYIVSVRLLHLFFDIPSQVVRSLHIKFILETDTRKLFEHKERMGLTLVAININQLKLSAIFFENSTINFY